ncbi:DUF885 domain-containing protein [Gilvimarinus sp. F26214L]|uniref:DUF885 domain-containing protein n=1 Tax=Gilvimarinus sp. DZF01 TaxID=3461371 RepID=UPI0040454DAE
MRTLANTLATTTTTLMLLFLVACSSGSRPADTQSAATQESERLNAWLNEQFEEDLDFSPQFRTRLGEKKDYDKLDDVSEAAMDRHLEWRRNSVAEMRSMFDYEMLTPEAKTSYDIWEYLLERQEEALPFRRHEYLLGRGGPHASLPNFLINFHKVETVEDMEAYIARLREVGPVLETYLARAQAAAAEGIRQPRFDYDFAAAEIERVLDGEPFSGEGDSPLWADATSKVESLEESGAVSPDHAAELLDQVRDALLTKMQPAYDRTLAWLVRDSENAPEPALGVWALPEGEAYYTNQLRQMTTLDLSADEIHEIGLKEVARIRAEMEAIKEQVNFDGTLQEFFVFLREDPQFYFPDTEEGRHAYLDLATRYLRDMGERLPEYFGILPKADLLVKRVEPFREQDGGAQHYMAGTPDGSRAGVFYAHLSDMSAMPKYQLEVIAYHEGNPGHHMQISIGQELENIPRFRTQYYYTAYVEGWALYSELLGKEMGFFQDPYSDFGRLSTEMWRAIRLVVDTGMHAKQWSEEQAVQYFLDNSPQPEAAVRSEIQRYLSWPGQATSYKIGMLKILELRAMARERLGEQFDIRGFHDTVLGGGALPLPILEDRVERWIEQQRG